MCQPYVLSAAAGADFRPYAVTSDDARVYWLQSTGQFGIATVMAVDKKGGETRKLGTVTLLNYARAFGRGSHVVVYTDDCCSTTNVFDVDGISAAMKSSGGASGRDAIAEVWPSGDLALYVGDNIVYANRADLSSYPQRVDLPFDGSVVPRSPAGNSRSFFFLTDGADIQRFEKTADTFVTDTKIAAKKIAHVPGIGLLLADDDALVAFVGPLESQSVVRLSLDGSEKTTLASIESGAAVIGSALQDGVVWWLTRVGAVGKTWRVPTAGGTAEAVATFVPTGAVEDAFHRRFVNSLAVDAKSAYFASAQGIMAVSN